ncbi:MAG: dienelactone hydrolase family protein [Caulobacterales bacterium]
MSTLHYVGFPSLHAAPLTISGRLCSPEGVGPHPAVIILHGSSGPTEREGGYAGTLNDAGFVTLEPDQWSARSRSSGERWRPDSVHETLPDLFGARGFLAARADVDASRIGVLGFQFGGAAAMLAATRAVDQSFASDGSFAAFLAFYPVCHLYNRVAGFEFADLVPSPILIATAALDEYDDDPGAGSALVKSLPALDRAKIRTAVFYGAHHAFDMLGPRRQVEHPAAHRGDGGLVTVAFDPEAAGRAHGLAVQFFSEMRGRPTRSHNGSSERARAGHADVDL